MLIAGRYRLHATIGRGAMGEVWQAYDEVLGRPVAVKLLLAQNTDPTGASRFRLEAQTAGRLNHPHVVGVIDFGEQEGRLFLVMELVTGDSLARVLSQAGSLPAEEVARIAAQAAAGLAVAHDQGIVHRDIKPGNLLLDADGSVKIGETGQIVGTSLYLAPERALGKPAGPASDVYSLGCLLYQLLTGRPPFHADSAVAILHHHLDTAPVPPRELGVGLPPAFENYLLGLLAKRPEDRPTARQTAEWFAAGAWRGRPEPLPAAAPLTEPKVPRATALGAVAGPGTNTAGAAPGSATTYAFPSAVGSTAGAHRTPRRQRSGLRAFVVHRSKAVSTVAALVVFLAALLVGLAWFSPDHSSAETPPTDPPRTTSSTPATSSTLSTPPTGGEGPGNSGDDGSDRQQHTQKGKNGRSKDDKG
ncbi:serine/threonine-protein kinase [Streptomyces sp. NBC_01483]|uniref:serine/threonine-protein kinase n=1 Tax=Streptomyces sp. NBC_01483 TaxID=2903883 RepID=UPI002E316D8D|nr:serine/threonine-protein kinase [Streptomyces sp. NBC_01483]